MVERVDSFKYLGVHISQDLSWSCHNNSLAKKARQRFYHLRRLRDFRLPSKVLRNFYTCTIKSILTGNITVWFGNSTKQDRQALQRVVRSAERITHTELPDLQTIYHKRCQTKARRIVKDPTHPNNRLFSLLRSGRRFRSLKTKTERLKRSLFPQAIRALIQGNWGPPPPCNITLCQDPTKHLSFIPSWDKEFLYLLGLEKVVQFRGECLDKIIFVPDKCADKGKQKKSPSAHSPKDPFTCAQCNTDFSSSWNQDKEGSILCWSCFQCTWRKEHWTLNGPKDYHLRPTFGNFSSPVLTPSHPVHTDFQVKQEASSYLLPLKGDQQVPKISASVYSAQTNPLSLYSSSFYVDSSSCSSSPSSSDLLSTPVDVFVRSPRHASSSSLSSPTFYFSSSSYSSSPSSSDGFSSPVFLSSNSGTSSPSDGSSSLSLPSTSELHSSSPLPFYSPPHCTTKQALQKGRPPYWMQISLPPLCKDDKVSSKEIKNEKNGHWTGNRLQHEGEKTNQCMFELTHTCMSLTSAVFSLSPLPLLRPDKYNLQKPQICHTDLALPSKAPSTLMPSLKKTARMEHIKEEAQA
ncbi:hypothetical protein P4O66_017101 [Electrophorus voltai]|uniref:GATA-type domain-containing protein n=1 Tax=Electrophorus voltai TaxID=2609070 RepID=A0AAD8YSZ7_9TELE|nr:hypothetical protein P4O66_017101 [Electrophorus voltai]